MVRSYLKHGPTEAFGLVAGSSSNSIFYAGRAYVPALEDILVWDVRKSENLAMWHDVGHRSTVTCIAQSVQGNIFAVGYADGSIRLWDAATSNVLLRFNGHRKAITALAFDRDGSRLASGSQDTQIILWDILAGEGLKRLAGHRDQITALSFLKDSDTNAENFVLSSSKDTYLKLWDLSLWHCVETVVGHHAEVWAFDIDPSGKYLLTGSSEGEVKGWGLRFQDSMDESDTSKDTKLLVPLGTLPVTSTQRVSQIQFHPTIPLLAIQSNDRSIEVFRQRSEDEIKKKRLRRRRRIEKTEPANSVGGEVVESPQISLEELYAPYLVVRPSGKLRSFCFDRTTKGTSVQARLQLLAALGNNSIELYTIPPPSPPIDKTMIPEASRTHIVDLPGHRTDIRALALSSDDSMLGSASNGQVKIWNLKTGVCLRTIDCGYVVCCSFLPGDRSLVLSSKSGHLAIIDTSSGAVVQETLAHDGPAWALCLRSDGQVVASGGADKTVKFWDVHQHPPLESEHRGLSKESRFLHHSRTLKLSDDVLAVRISPDTKYVAVALLDSTVKLFYQDSLKYYLSLYGHKLPVLSMDIAHDSKLLLTSSADKNIKIWGLDFGDCHRSIFAHEDSIMQVAFEANSHLFWSVSKDHLLKYWDGDKFELIQKLEGHQSEIWALALSHNAAFVVTGSHDKSIRVWEKLDEPLFLEEERERELENLHESNFAEIIDQRNNFDGVVDGNSYIGSKAEALAVQKQTVETLMAGEKIVEALDLADGEMAKMSNYDSAADKTTVKEALDVPLPRNPILAALDMQPDEYVLSVVNKIPASSLTDALIVLPYAKIISLLFYLDRRAKAGADIILICRILFFLTKVFHHQIAQNEALRSSLIPLRKELRCRLQQQRETVLFNLSALSFLKNCVDYETAPIDDVPIGKLDITDPTKRIKKRKRVKI